MVGRNVLLVAVVVLVVKSSAGFPWRARTDGLTGNGELVHIVSRYADGERSKRSLSMPDDLDFRFVLKDRNINIRVKRSGKNKPEVTNFPLFVIENGMITRRQLPPLQTAAVYTNDTHGHSLVARRLQDRAEFILEGVFYDGLEQYHLMPDSTGLHRVHTQDRIMDFQGDYIDNTVGPSKPKDTGSGRKRKRRSALTALGYHTDGMRYSKIRRSLTKADHISRQLLKERKRRQSVATYEIELFMVADFKDYSEWLDYYRGNKTETEIEMKLYYAFVANSISQRYRSIANVDPYLKIDILITGLLIVNSREDSYWTENYVLSPGSAYVEANDALESFRRWIRLVRSSLPDSDHWMLFTGYDIYTDKNPNIAGLAKLGGLCSYLSVSIIEQDNTGSVGATAAHELGHSLSARHDGEVKECQDEDNYVMSRKLKTPDAEKVASRPWQFSPCSVDAFREFLSRVKCGQQSATLRGSALATELGGGQVFSADLQCQLALGQHSFFGRSLQHTESYSSMCRRLYCAVPQHPGLFQAIFAMEKTTCGDGKWCIQGKCAPDTLAPRVRDSCPQGDDPAAPCVREDCRYYTQRTQDVYCCKTCHGQSHAHNFIFSPAANVPVQLEAHTQKAPDLPGFELHTTPPLASSGPDMQLSTTPSASSEPPLTSSNANATSQTTQSSVTSAQAAELATGGGVRVDVATATNVVIASADTTTITTTNTTTTTTTPHNGPNHNTNATFMSDHAMSGYASQRTSSTTLAASGDVRSASTQGPPVPTTTTFSPGKASVHMTSRATTTKGVTPERSITPAATTTLSVTTPRAATISSTTSRATTAEVSWPPTRHDNVVVLPANHHSGVGRAKDPSDLASQGHGLLGSSSHVINSDVIRHDVSHGDVVGSTNNISSTAVVPLATNAPITNLYSSSPTLIAGAMTLTGGLVSTKSHAVASDNTVPSIHGNPGGGTATTTSLPVSGAAGPRSEVRTNLADRSANLVPTNPPAKSPTDAPTKPTSRSPQTTSLTTSITPSFPLNTHAHTTTATTGIRPVTHSRGRRTEIVALSTRSAQADTTTPTTETASSPEASGNPTLETLSRDSSLDPQQPTNQRPVTAGDAATPQTLLPVTAGHTATLPTVQHPVTARHAVQPSVTASTSVTRGDAGDIINTLSTPTQNAPQSAVTLSHGVPHAATAISTADTPELATAALPSSPSPHPPTAAVPVTTTVSKSARTLTTGTVSPPPIATVVSVTAGQPNIREQPAGVSSSTPVPTVTSAGPGSAAGGSGSPGALSHTTLSHTTLSHTSPTPFHTATHAATIGAAGGSGSPEAMSRTSSPQKSLSDTSPTLQETARSLAWAALLYGALAPHNSTNAPASSTRTQSGDSSTPRSSHHVIDVNSQSTYQSAFSNRQSTAPAAGTLSPTQQSAPTSSAPAVVASSTESLFPNAFSGLEPPTPLDVNLFRNDGMGLVNGSHNNSDSNNSKVIPDAGGETSTSLPTWNMFLRGSDIQARRPSSNLFHHEPFRQAPSSVDITTTAPLSGDGGSEYGPRRCLALCQMFREPTLNSGDRLLDGMSRFFRSRLETMFDRISHVGEYFRMTDSGDGVTPVRAADGLASRIFRPGPRRQQRGGH